MTLIGLDLNATRARAVQGPLESVPVVLRLEDDSQPLPLALGLAERRLVVGRAGLALCRREPHQVCVNFLPSLGQARKWVAGRHSLDAAQALGLVFERLQRSFSRAQGVTLALPPYLSEPQTTLV